MSATPPVINLQGVTLVVAFDDETLVVDPVSGDAEVVAPAPGASLFVESEQLLFFTGNDDAMVLSAGEQGPPGVDGVHGQGPTLMLVGVAGHPLSGHRIVRLDATGRYIYADVNAPLDGVLACGMTTGAAAEGAEVLVQTTGPFVEPTWSWVPDEPIYLGANGALTQIPIFGVFIKQVGIALATTLAAIDMREPIYL